MSRFQPCEKCPVEHVTECAHCPDRPRVQINPSRDGSWPRYISGAAQFPRDPNAVCRSLDDLKAKLAAQDRVLLPRD